MTQPNVSEAHTPKENDMDTNEQTTRTEHRRFEERWQGVDGPEYKKINLRDNDSVRRTPRRNRVIIASFLLTALLLFITIIVLFKNIISTL
ncbi:MAG: hypothetical protein K5864_01775 [Bacteroidales bacterium]|nr:hypothetical protein [Bacteroidales bacterium]